MKINVLGTEYEILFKNEKEDIKLKDYLGYTDVTIKQIIIANVERDEKTINDLEYLKKKTLRHEIIHAFLFESGLWENSQETTWATNEEMADWIAIQYPKMLEVFKEVNAL